MELQDAFRSRLLAAGALTALVDDRVHWGKRPQNGALPALVLTKVAPGQDWTHDGPDSLVNPWVQIDVYGASLPSVSSVASALQAEMQRIDIVNVEGWKFLPPATLEGDQWPEAQDLAKGGSSYRIMHSYRFWARPE